MLTSKWRVVIIVIAIMGMAIAIYLRSYQLAVLFVGIIAFTVWSNFKDGTVLLASEAFHKKEYDKARKYLDDIKYPEYLRNKRRNYYEFISGSLALQLLDDEAAERHFQIASRLSFRKPNDKAIVFVHLANINLRKGNYDRVRRYLQMASKLDISLRVSQIINKIENEIPKE